MAAPDNVPKPGSPHFSGLNTYGWGLNAVLWVGADLFWTVWADIEHLSRAGEHFLRRSQSEHFSWAAA